LDAINYQQGSPTSSDEMMVGEERKGEQEEEWMNVKKKKENEGIRIRYEIRMMYDAMFFGACS
jgi:hypothetical protein